MTVKRFFLYKFALKLFLSLRLPPRMRYQMILHNKQYFNGLRCIVRCNPTRQRHATFFMRMIFRFPRGVEPLPALFWCPIAPINRTAWKAFIWKYIQDCSENYRATINCPNRGHYVACSVGSKNHWLTAAAKTGARFQDSNLATKFGLMLPKPCDQMAPPGRAGLEFIAFSTCTVHVYPVK